MTSERIQRRVERLLDQIELAADAHDWPQVRLLAEDALRLNPDNADARAYLAAAARDATGPLPAADESPPSQTAPAGAAQPTSFASGRYEVRRFLGEGGRKRVYLAHDAQLDRDVAFALIKTDGLDEAARVRVAREAQSMGRLGSHPHIVTVYDIGEESGAPYLVLPVLPLGDVEGVIEKAPDHKLPIEQAVKIATETCLGLEFSHAKGIIHRDLKPGNVWLAEDGRAMIGDFGLAVAVDRSRLTQAGMMVGTVSYMPPEQAMGGEVTPRSDLYSLGAMLYEMVCGRPPFVGDESVAIIGQHLNTPPVAPSWHRPDCPPGLEALILRLLEKDPSRRPASATEVREALQAVASSPLPLGEGGRRQGEGDVPVTSIDPLYRRTFVGRENETRQLHQAYDAAVSGQGGLVMVVGEPGIGKTALCEQLATYVQLRGGRTLVGHCYEEGSLSLPYLAFVEAMRSYVLARDPDGLRSDLGSGAAEVARIVSEVRDRVHVELRDASDPEDDRWRLLNAVSTFLRNASAVQPLVIVLEDLHWADRGTLDLLLHVARNMDGARLLLVGTYRDVEVDRAHPLSSTLAELRRAQNFTRVPLRGLTVEEVHRMYSAIRGQDVAWGQAEAVHRQTEGNPLFIQEVIRYMVEEGYVQREGGRWVLTEGTVPGSGLPEGLRDVVGKRLSRLSESCNRLLSVAAVIGRDFDLAVLRAVVGLTEDELLSGIEEAVRVGVLEERSLPGALRYRFAHAFFRTALYEEMIAARRLRLHQEVARALEAQYATRREEHAAELAEHYGQSTDRADLAKAVEYSELAAKRAMLVFAYAEAEGHLRRCLEVQQVLDPEDKARRCDLLLSLGEAILPQENPVRVAEMTASDAFGLAELLGDAQLCTRAALQALEAYNRQGNIVSRDAYIMWAERAGRHAADGTSARVYSDAHLGMAAISAVQMDRPLSVEERQAYLLQSSEYIHRAIDLARSLGDNPAFIAAAGRALMNLNALRDRETLVLLSKEILSVPRAGVRSADLATCLNSAARMLIGIGLRDEAEALWRELASVEERTLDFTLSVGGIYRSAILSAIDGRLEEASVLFEAASSRGEDTGVLFAGFWLRTPPGIRSLAWLGVSYEEFLPPPDFPPRIAQAAKSCWLSHLGRREESMALRRRLFPLVADAARDSTASEILCHLLEASTLDGDLEYVDSLAPRFVPLADQIFVMNLSSVGRLLGEASVLVDQHDKARGFYAQALEVCGNVRFRPEIALIRLSLAEILLDHYPDERDAAIEHLDFAIVEFRDMKMQPALERALGRRGLLKA